MDPIFRIYIETVLYLGDKFTDFMK